MTCLRAALSFASIVATLPPMVLLGHDTPVVTVSSASFEQGAPVAPDSIASGFGDELATATGGATSVPLPTDIAGTTVVVTDSSGVKRRAALFFVSPKQVNFLIPAGTATGPATLTVTSGDGEVSPDRLRSPPFPPPSSRPTPPVAGSQRPPSFGLRRTVRRRRIPLLQHSHGLDGNSQDGGD